MNDWHWTKKNHQHLRGRSPSLKRCLTLRTFVNSRYTLFQVLNCSKYKVGAAQKWWWWRCCEDNAKDRTWLPGSRVVACASSPTASHRTTPRPSLPSRRGLTKLSPILRSYQAILEPIELSGIRALSLPQDHTLPIPPISGLWTLQRYQENIAGRRVNPAI